MNDKVNKNNKIIKKIYHLSDIHIKNKNISRNDEYEKIFKLFINDIEKEENKNESIVVITGDFFDNKDIFCADSFRLSSQFIYNILDNMECIIILGNHDYCQNRPLETDSIKSLCVSINSNRFHYFEYTNLYNFYNIDFSIISLKDLLDNKKSCGINKTLPIIPYKDSKDDKIKICLIHATLKEIGGDMIGTIDLNWLNKKQFNYILLGDYHINTIKTIKDKDKDDIQTILAYPGSLIQQNFGESPINHGYLVWNIKTKNNKPIFISLYNEISYLNIEFYNDNFVIKINNKIILLLEYFNLYKPKKVHIKLKSNINNLQNLIDIINDNKIIILSSQFIKLFENEIDNYNIINDNENHYLNNDFNIKERIKIFLIKNKIDLSLINNPNLFIPNIKYLNTTILDNKIIQIEELINDLNNSEETFKNKNKIELYKLTFSYVFNFGANNIIDFYKLKNNIVQIKGKNGVGKSTIIDIINYMFYKQLSDNRKIDSNNNLNSSILLTPKLNSNKLPFIKLEIKINNKHYILNKSFKCFKNNKPELNFSILKKNDSGSNSTICTREKEYLEFINNYINCLKFDKINILSQFSNSNFSNEKCVDQLEILENCFNFNYKSCLINFIDKLYKLYNLLINELNKKITSTKINYEDEDEDDNKTEVELNIFIKKYEIKKNKYFELLNNINNKIIIDENMFNETKHLLNEKHINNNNNNIKLKEIETKLLLLENINHKKYDNIVKNNKYEINYNLNSLYEIDYSKELNNDYKLDINIINLPLINKNIINFLKLNNFENNFNENDNIIEIYNNTIELNKYNLNSFFKAPYYSFNDIDKFIEKKSLNELVKKDIIYNNDCKICVNREEVINYKLNKIKHEEYKEYETDKDINFLIEDKNKHKNFNKELYEYLEKINYKIGNINHIIEEQINSSKLLFFIKLKNNLINEFEILNEINKKECLINSTYYYHYKLKYDLYEEKFFIYKNKLKQLEKNNELKEVYKTNLSKYVEINNYLNDLLSCFNNKNKDNNNLNFTSELYNNYICVFINKEIKKLLNKISNVKFTFEINYIDNENKNNCLVFNKILQNGDKHNINFIGGNERLLFNISIRYLFSQLMTNSYNFLIFDESFSVADSDNKENINKLLNYLNTKFDNIFIISHDKSILQFIDKTIEVIEFNNESFIK